MSDIRKNKGKGTAKAESKKARTAFSSQLAVCSKRLKSRCRISGKTRAKEQQKQKVKKLSNAFGFYVFLHLLPTAYCHCPLTIDK